MYSQNDEELHILEHAGGPGILLDVGAFDGRTFSNSLALVERGWSGVLVEPSYHVFPALVKLHGRNPKLKLVQSLVGVKGGIVPFWNSPDAVSTTSSSHYETWKKQGQFDPVSFSVQVRISDLMMTFPELRRASVINIDTEGTSAELFLNFPFSLCLPKVFIVEYDNKKKECEEMASWFGYRTVYSSGENLVMVHD